MDDRCVITDEINLMVCAVGAYLNLSSAEILIVEEATASQLEDASAVCINVGGYMQHEQNNWHPSKGGRMHGWSPATQVSIYGAAAEPNREPAYQFCPQFVDDGLLQWSHAWSKRLEEIDASSWEGATEQFSRTPLAARWNKMWHWERSVCPACKEKRDRVHKLAAHHQKLRRENVSSQELYQEMMQLTRELKEETEHRWPWCEAEPTASDPLHRAMWYTHQLSKGFEDREWGDTTLKKLFDGMQAVVENSTEDQLRAGVDLFTAVVDNFLSAYSIYATDIERLGKPYTDYYQAGKSH